LCPLERSPITSFTYGESDRFKNLSLQFFLKRSHLNILFSNTSIMFISFVLIQKKRSKEKVKTSRPSVDQIRLTLYK
ncbi:MAG: hypothetical protein J7K51_01675, partial [Thermotogae bacterium]|nr:hypothetical protein [Thermotogota bacterium]